MEDYTDDILYQKFDMYYNAAKKAYKEERGDLAKRNYMLAAEMLLKLAKRSSPKLKQARIDRAKRLVEIADNIDVVVEKKKFRNSGGLSSSKAPADKQEENGDDDTKQWQSAEIPDIHFSDIAGLEDVKKAITTRMINPVKHRDIYEAYGKKSGGGLLLYGPPGTGKTMIAKAIACEVGAKFYAVKGSDIVSKWVGDSEKNISSLFETARQDDLAIIFIDEMDSLIGRRGVDQHNDKRVNEFLQQMDGFVGKNPNLLLLGATNRPWDIDSAAMRSGRFSQKIYVPLPDEKARDFLFRKSLKKAPLDASIDYKRLVSLSDGYSGADITELCDRALENPILKSIEQGGGIVKVTMNDFMTAFSEVPPTVETSELKRFEAYRGLKRRLSPVNKIEHDDVIEDIDDKDDIPQSMGDNTVKFLSDAVNISVDGKASLECYVDDNYSLVSLKIDGNNYICTSKIKNWTSEPFEIEQGTYDVEVYGDGKLIATRPITFSKGMVENNFDL